MRVGGQHKDRGHSKALAFLLLRLSSWRSYTVEADRDVYSDNHGIFATIGGDRLFVDAKDIIREIFSNGDDVSSKWWFAVEKLRSY